MYCTEPITPKQLPGINCPETIAPEQLPPKQFPRGNSVVMYGVDGWTFRISSTFYPECFPPSSRGNLNVAWKCSHLDRQPSREPRGDGANLVHPETVTLAIRDHANLGPLVLSAEALRRRSWRELARVFHEPQTLNQRCRLGCIVSRFGT